MAVNAEYQEYYTKLHDDFRECGDFFAAIGNETRQLIILEAIKAGPEGIRPGEIATHVNLSRPAVSHHLKILSDAGVFHIREVGTMNYYFICIKDLLPLLEKTHLDLKALIEAMYGDKE